MHDGYVVALNNIVNKANGRFYIVYIVLDDKKFNVLRYLTAIQRARVELLTIYLYTGA